MNYATFCPNYVQLCLEGDATFVLMKLYDLTTNEPIKLSDAINRIDMDNQDKNIQLRHLDNEVNEPFEDATVNNPDMPKYQEIPILKKAS